MLKLMIGLTRALVLALWSACILSLLFVIPQPSGQAVLMLGTVILLLHFVEDLLFQQGSSVAAGVHNKVARVFFGRKFSEGPRHEFGLGIGFHWLEIGAYIEGEAFINDIPSGVQRGDVDASTPMPNSDDWRGGAELRYRGPFLALTTNW